LSTVGSNGLAGILPPPGSLSKEDQSMLAAQTEALQKMGILPGVNASPNFPPPVGGGPAAGMPLQGPKNDMMMAGGPFVGGGGHQGDMVNNLPPPFIQGPPPMQQQQNNGFNQQPIPPFGGHVNQGRPGAGGGIQPFENGPPAPWNNGNDFRNGNNFNNRNDRDGGGFGGNNRGGGFNDRRGNHNGGSHWDNGFRGGDHGSNRGGGSQRRGDRSNYDREQEYKDSKIGTRPCKFYVMRGSCRDGDKCRYIHQR